MSKQDETLERIYTVPLSRAWITARHKRTKRAVKVLREFAERHMKSSEIKIDTALNERLWDRGITKPPRRITVRMEKDEDGVITISLPKEEKVLPTEQELPRAEMPEKTQESPAPVTTEVKQEVVTDKKPKTGPKKKAPQRKKKAKQ
jgi:large subunit ribosomal protein L31e